MTWYPSESSKTSLLLREREGEWYGFIASLNFFNSIALSWVWELPPLVYVNFHLTAPRLPSSTQWSNNDTYKGVLAGGLRECAHST